MKELAPVILLFLSASVGTASAEPAWVLWEEPLGWRAWLGWRSSPVRAFESRHNCEELQTAFGFVRATVVDEETRKNATAIGYKEGMSYRCLPDTIDPRGPKGK